MQVTSAAFRKGTGDFMTWWMGELSALAPAPVRRALEPDTRTIAITLDGDRISITRIEGDSSETVGHFTADGDRIATAPPELERILQTYSPKQWSWGLYLGPDVVLSDVLRLPAAARENFAEAIEFQIDRQTPFDRGEIYFDCRPLPDESSGAMFTAEYVVAPRATVDSVLRRMAGLGIPVDFVTTAYDLQGARTPFNLLPEGKPGHRQRARGINSFLAVLAVLLGAAAVYLSLDNDRRHAAALNARLGQLQTEARVAARLRDALSAESRNVNSVLDLKQNRPSVTRVLNDLSALLPDDTWVSRFSYKDGTARIVVQAPESAATVGLIEGSDRFVGAKMITAVRRLKNENRERFTLGFSVKPVEKP